MRSSTALAWLVLAVVVACQPEPRQLARSPTPPSVDVSRQMASAAPSTPAAATPARPSTSAEVVADAASPARPARSAAPEPGAGPLVAARPFGPDPDGGGASIGRLRFEAGFVLRSGDGRFGGLSGIWIDPERSRLVMVSDRGVFWSVHPEYGPDDRLVGFADWQAIKPERMAGDPRGRYGGDAEALTGVAQDGLVVAYESFQRLRRFALADLHAAPGPLARPDELAERSNRGIEALATLADGTLLAIAEGIFDDAGDNVAFLIDGERVERLGYQPAPGYAPTGADRLDGVIYVLERRFSWFGGFAARVVALPAGEVEPGARLAGLELARLQPLVAENFEGIAARRARDGRVLLHLISDDNFMALQQTLLVQLSVDDRTLAGGPLGESVRLAHEGTERQQ